MNFMPINGKILSRRLTWKKLGFDPLIVHYYWLESVMEPCRELNKYSKLKRRYTLLYLGRLIKKRGVDLIIKAFHRFIKRTNADSALIIAGDGPLKPELENSRERIKPD